MFQWNNFRKNMKASALMLGLGVGLVSCSSNPPLYQSKEFSVYRDRVEQGQYTAEVLSNTHMKSNYESPLNSVFSRAVSFKYSINRKDNDLPVNNNRRIVVRPENGVYKTPIMKFGVNNPDTTPVDDVKDPMEPKTKVVFRVDLTEVMKSFKEKGFYIDQNGEKISKEDFNGVYIAGGVPPLSRKTLGRI